MPIQPCITNSNELLTLLDNSINEIYVFKQSNLRFLWANQGALDNTQYPFKELTHLTPLELKPEFSENSFRQLLSTINASKPKLQFETYHRRKDGTKYAVEVHLEAGHCCNEDVYIAIILDITEREKQRNNIERLSQIEQSLSNILYHSRNEIYVFYQETLKMAWANRTAIDNIGFTLEELTKLTPLDLKPELQHDQFKKILEPLKTNKTDKVIFETIHRRKDGSFYHVDVHIQQTIMNQHPAFVAIIIDVSDKIKHDKLIHEMIADKAYQATHDEITDLANRRALQENIINELCRANNKHLLAVFVDIDNFKDINDSFGHDVGDAVLWAVATRLQSHAQKDSHLIRFGSDEFLYLIPNLYAQELVDQFNHDVLNTIKDVFEIGSNTFSLTASIGSAIHSVSQSTMLDKDTINQLIQNADYALASAKKRGKNHAVHFTRDIHNYLKDKTYFLANLNTDSAFDSFYLVYQPIIDLKKNCIIGAEALLRWQSGDTALSPLQFIPVLEESGKIIPVGAWVIDKITDFCQQQSNLLPPGFKLCFNASVVQIRRKSFVRTLETFVPRLDHANSCIEMEITESIFADNIETVSQTLDQIRKLGVNISIDDFGTGYSSLAYLKQLPITTLKIDKQFIDDCDKGSNDAILAAIFTLANQMKLNIVTEGIETNEQLQKILALSADHPHCKLYAQGYYFYKPLPKDELLKLLQNTKHNQ